MIRYFGVFLALATAAGAWGQESYPEWFLEPPPPGWSCVFARSEGDALDRAAMVLAAYQELRVSGDFQQFYDDSIDDRTWNNSDFVFDFNPQRASDLRTSLRVGSRVLLQLITGDTLYLVGPKDQPVPDTTESNGTKPKWAEAWGGVESGERYGVGRFSLQGRSADAWVKAEERAVLHLLTAYQLKIGQWTKSTKTGETDQLTRLRWIRLNYHVSDLRVGGRWVDPETNDAVVLVRAPQTSIRGMD